MCSPSSPGSRKRAPDDSSPSATPHSAMRRRRRNGSSLDHIKQMDKQVDIDRFEAEYGPGDGQKKMVPFDLLHSDVQNVIEAIRRGEHSIVRKDGLRFYFYFLGGYLYRCDGPDCGPFNLASTDDNRHVVPIS